MGFDSIFKLSVILNLIDNMTSPAQNAFGSMMKTGTMLTGAGVQLAQALTAPVTASFDTKSAIAELSSLGVEELALLESAANDFSNTWAGTTKADFISAAYDIKSGIASLSDEGVAKYTEMAGLTAKATKSNIATMTDLFATGYGIYKSFYANLSDMEFAELFSAGISTSVKQFKTNGNEMAAAIQSLGASATNAQVPLEEQLSILGMLQATMSGSEAGTKYNAFLRSAAKGGAALGMNFTDANNQLLSMPEILDMLHGKFGDTLDAAEKMQLQQAFGDSETIKLIDLLYGKVGDLENNIVGMYGSLGQGTAATLEMANAINSSDPAKLEILQQKFHNIGETISNAVTPKVMEYADKISGVVDKAGEWVSSHGEVVNAIFSVLSGLAMFLIVSGTLTTTIGLVGGQITKWINIAKMAKGGFQKLVGIIRGSPPIIRSFGTSLLNMGKTAVTSLLTSLQPLIASVWSFTAALLANPVTWIVIGIVALIAAIVLLYNKCEWFRNIVDSIFAAIKEKFGAALDFAKNVFGGIADVIGTVMGAAKDTVAQNLSNMKQAYEEHGGGIKGIAAAAVEGVKGFYTAGFTFMDNLTGGKLTTIKNKWSEKFSPVKEITGNIMGAAKDTVAEKLSNMEQAYEQHGGGIKGTAAATVEGVKGFYTAGFTFMDNLTGGKLTTIKNKWSEKFSPVKEITGNVMDAAKDTAIEKLSNMKQAYEQHGGGIKGAAAATVEGVKGFYTAGFTFMDNLTGGKLTTIKNKWSEKFSPVKEITGNVMDAAKDTAIEKLSNMKQAYEQHGGGIKGAAAATIEGVKGFYTAGFTFMDNLTGGKLTAIKEKFSQGIQNIKNKITDSISWFKNSGKKIMDTFTEGIKSALNKPVDMVKNALQKVRNMLPFSDAKEGPLSSLTLSGSKVLSTMAEGIKLTENLPAQEVETALGKVDLTLQKNNQRQDADKIKESGSLSGEQGGQIERTVIRINNLSLNVDLKDIESLKKLQQLFAEIEDNINSGGEGTPEPA